MAKKFTTILREAEAASRRAQRERLRRERERERLARAAERASELAQAATEVELYDAQIRELLSIHKHCSTQIDWERIASSGPPAQPERSDVGEHEARAKHENYRPSLTDKMLRRVDKVKAKLEDGIRQARIEDEDRYLAATQGYEAAFAKWERDVARARLVLEGSLDTFVEVLQEAKPFESLEELGIDVEVSFETPTLAVASVFVAGLETIPSEAKTLLKSGKLSVKTHPKTKHLAMYQDHVCGVVLRVAREIAALLPVETSVVTAMDEMLNTKTGHLEWTPVFTIIVPRTTMAKLYFEMLDPSDAMTNFVHRMKFTATKGFSAIEPLPADYLEMT